MEKAKAVIERIDQHLARLAINVQGWPPNTRFVRSNTVVCVAAGTPYQAPAMVVPSGMRLLIKSFSFNPAASLIQIGTSAADCLNFNSSFSLAPGETVAYAIENAGMVYVSSNMAGVIAIFSCEDRR